MSAPVPGAGMRLRLALALLCALIASAALVPAGASGDGDPASDVLVSQSLFLPYDTGVSGAGQARLQTLLSAADRAGLPIRVAVIPSEYDLGSVGVLWRNPRTYARFLGIELSLTYGNRLLVVMPNGFGFDWPHHSTAAAYRVLAGIGIGSGGDGMLASAEAAVRRLAVAAGVDLAGSSTGGAAAGAERGSGAEGGSGAVGDGTGSGAAGNGAGSGAGAGSRGETTTGSALVRLLFALLVLAIVVALAATVLIFLRDLWREQPAGTESGQPGGAGRGQRVGTRRSRRPGRLIPGAPRAFPPRRPHVVGGAAVLCVCAVVPVALLTGDSSGSHAPTSAPQSVPNETPTTWPQGQRAAPNFELTDQRGRGVSLGAYRGRPVLVTFIDPLCRNQCPLAAKILSEADRRLPAAQRPEIIAVSVDIYADTRADLGVDFTRWSLVPQWQWAVGSPRQLAAVWKRYYAEVEVQTKHIAGTTVHYITHSEMAYLVDGRGYERALFSWPFSEHEVEAAVRRLGRS